MNVTASRQPIFLHTPPVIIWSVAVLLVIHALVSYVLPPDWVIGIYLQLAFIPALFQADGLRLWPFLTHALLHIGWEHVIMNSIWLFAFGIPVARRLHSARRFLAFYALCTAVAIWVQYLSAPSSIAPIVGASGGVSAIIGAAARFALPTNKHWFQSAGADRNAPLLPLRQALRQRTVLVFITLWIGLNVIFGVISLSPTGQPVQIAWPAHIAGFIAGLLLFVWFDSPPRSPSGGPGNVRYGQWIGAWRKQRTQRNHRNGINGTGDA